MNTSDNSLQKDSSILDIVTKIDQAVGSAFFTVKDYWDADLCAIGVTDRNKNFLIYISTWEKENGTFHVEIEDLQSNKVDFFESVERHPECTLEELLTLCEKHLRS